MICLALSVVSILIPCITSYSSGDVQACDAYGQWGCPNYNWTLNSVGEPDRLGCNNPIGSLMDWVAPPERSDAYSVRTGDHPEAPDSTTYSPGELMKIYVRVLDYDFKFRGLLLYAVADDGRVVGNWEFPRSVESPMFWVPPGCPGRVLHSTASRKPFLNILFFRAPEVGTGRITFHCLIKKGPANHGYFYYPMQQDLTLSENQNPYRQTWFKTALGQSCDALCATMSYGGCDENTMRMSNNQDAFESGVGRHHICNLPTLSSCTNYAPSVTDDDTCYYHDSDCAAWRNQNQPAEMSCGSSSSNANGYRLCVCGDGSGDPANPTNPDNPNNPDYTPPSPSGATRSGSNNIMIVQLLVGLIAWFGGRRSSYFLVGALILFGSIGSCDAHNWMHTPGRAYTLASTIKPCQGRKKTDTHAQIAPGQEFAVHWATGHSRDSWFLVLHEDDAVHMGDPDLISIMNDYIDNDPYQQQMNHLVPEHQRYHGATTDSPSDSSMAIYSTALFDRQMDPTDSTDSAILSNLAHPGARHKGGLGAPQTVWRYSQDSLANDRRVTYASEEYPWIEGVYRYNHMTHLATDWDGTVMTVAGRRGPGHYIVHWRWNGYYDCFDIDVRDTVVANIYGLPTDPISYIWNRVDHCQYINPKSIQSSCWQSPLTAKYCQTARGNNLNNRRERFGINVVPLHNPASVWPDFQGITNIPWSDPMCASSWTRLEGSVSQSAFPMSNWNRETLNGKTCSSSSLLEEPTTLKNVVLMCATQPGCLGISWEINNNAIETGLHTFATCSSAATTDNQLWNTYLKRDPVDFSVANGNTFKISFQPGICANPRAEQRPGVRTCMDVPFTLPNGWYPDIGEEFGPKQDGLEYGWNCDKKKTRMKASSGENPTKDNTYVRDIFTSCHPYINFNGIFNRSIWEIRVPNGVYDVRTYHSRTETDDTLKMSGCTIENVPMSLLDVQFPNPTTFTTQVQVADERITLAGQFDNRNFNCNTLNTLEATMVASDYDDAFAPYDRNPWWQMQLESLQPIGLVEVRRPPDSNCGSWWPFRGNKCLDPATSTPKGFFDRDEQNTGFIVGVSNSSCSGRTCNGEVCGRFDRAYRQDMHIDCKGIIGRYVYVQLPGNDRILYFESVEVHRAAAIGEPDDYVCYVVEARAQTATEPEYEVVLDPDDPIFYSTCYVREENKTWVDLTYPPTPSPWHFGRRCIDCQNHAHNLALDDSTLPSVKWIVNEKCIDCDAEDIPIENEQGLVLAYENFRCDESKHLCGTASVAYPLKGLCILELNFGGRNTRDTKTLDECQLLASRDSRCGNVIMYNAASEECRCYLTNQCCGECTPTRRLQNNWMIYEMVPTAPVSASNCILPLGVLSDDGGMCCSSSCAVEGACGVDGNQCFDLPDYGSCCKRGLQKNCTTHGPPCLM